MWATNPSQFGEWVLVTISPAIFQNGYILGMWKRHIDLPTKSISFYRCSSSMTGLPVLTIWMRHSHILPCMAGTILTLQKFSTNYPLPINGEKLVETIFYASSILKMSHFSALCNHRYIIWMKVMSVEFAEASINHTQRCIRRFQNSQLWTPIPCTNWRGLGTRS